MKLQDKVYAKYLSGLTIPELSVHFDISIGRICFLIQLYKLETAAIQQLLKGKAYADTETRKGKHPI